MCAEPCEKCGFEYKDWKFPKRRCPNCGNEPIYGIIANVTASHKTLGDALDDIIKKVNELVYDKEIEFVQCIKCKTPLKQGKIIPFKIYCPNCDTSYWMREQT